MYLYTGEKSAFQLVVVLGSSYAEFFSFRRSEDGVPQNTSGKSNRVSFITSERFELSRDNYISIYGGLVGATTLLSLLRTFLFFHVTVNSSKRLHDRMFRAVLRAPIYFFDTNPVGKYNCCSCCFVSLLLSLLLLLLLLLSSSLLILYRELKQMRTTMATSLSSKNISTQSLCFTEHIFALVTLLFLFSLNFSCFKRLFLNENIDVNSWNIDHVLQTTWKWSS